MQGALSALLVSVAGHYAHLSPSDVGIGINGGRLVVSDVQLRPESLESPALPFRIVSGRADVLRVNVPWGALSSSPVTVYLENVVLVAGPRSAPRQGDTPPPPLPPELPSAQKWHQTRLGRVLFNAQAEIVGLQVEYRDVDCVARIEAAALRAHSVNEQWIPAFVPLDSSEGAVAMRKLFVVHSLRCTMIPVADVIGKSADKCFEDTRPMLEDVNVTVKALVCAGESFVDSEMVGGLHTEVDVELDDPAINISKRQVDWIQWILDDAAGISPAPSTGERTPRRARNIQNIANGQYESDGPSEPSGTPQVFDPRSSTPHRSASEPPPNTNTSTMSGLDGENGILNDMDAASLSSFVSHEENDDEYTELLSDQQTKRSGFFSFWSAIVEENSDETVDDAAYALGLSSVVDEKQRIIEEAIEESRPNVDEQPTEEVHVLGTQFARKAVEAAAAAGGMTFRVRFRTPDEQALSRVKELEEQLTVEKAFREGLEDYENTLRAANERTKEAEESAESFKQKNEALLRELKELEEMTAKAGRNKDAIIRQTEAALIKAEGHLQVLLMEREAAEERNEGTWRSNRRSSTDTIVVNHDSDDEMDPEEEPSETESESIQEERQEEQVAEKYEVPQADLRMQSEEQDVGESRMESIELDVGESKFPMVVEKEEVVLFTPEKKIEMQKEMELRDRLEQKLISPVPVPVNKAVHASYAEEGLTLL